MLPHAKTYERKRRHRNRNRNRYCCDEDTTTTMGNVTTSTSDDMDDYNNGQPQPLPCRRRRSSRMPTLVKEIVCAPPAPPCPPVPYYGANCAEFFTTQQPGFQTVVAMDGYYPISSQGPVMTGGFLLGGAGPQANTVTVSKGGRYHIFFTLFPTLSSVHSAGIQLEIDGVRIQTAVAVGRLLEANSTLDTTIGNDTFVHLRDGATVRLLNHTSTCVVLRQMNVVQLRFVSLPC